MQLTVEQLWQLSYWMSRYICGRHYLGWQHRVTSTLNTPSKKSGGPWLTVQYYYIIHIQLTKLRDASRLTDGCLAFVELSQELDIQQSVAIVNPHHNELCNKSSENHKPTEAPVKLRSWASFPLYWAQSLVTLKSAVGLAFWGHGQDRHLRLALRIGC